MVDVRGIRNAEIDRLSTITVDVYAVAFAAIDVGEYLATLADVADRVREAEVLVAVDGDRLLGGVTYVPDADNPYAEFEDTDAAGMRMLAVDPTAQGRGVGAALVRACLRRARHNGRRRVVLHTMAELVAAQRLYERFGFERAPWRDWRPQPHILLLGYELMLDGALEASPAGRAAGA